MTDRIWNSRFIRIFIAATLFQLANQIIMTVLPLYLNDLNFAPSVLGLGHALSALASTAGAPLAGALADKRGKTPVLVCGFLLMGASMLGFIAFPFMLPIMIIRLLQGLSFPAGSVAYTAIAADVLPREKVRNGLSYFGIAATIAGAAGPFVGYRLISGTNYSPTWVGGAAIFGIGALLALTLRGGSVSAQKTSAVIKTKGLWNIFEKSAFLPGLIQMIFMASSSAYAYLPTFGVEIGARDISLFFTLQAVASLGANLFLGKTIHKVTDPRWMLVSGWLMCAASFLCLFLVKGNTLFYMAGALYGLGNGVICTAVSALSMAKAPENRRGAAAATYNCMGSLGYSLGSLLWGIAVGAMGYRNIYGIAVMLPIAALILSLLAFRPSGDKGRE